MKKTLSFLLALCLLLTAASALADLDLSYLKEYPDVFDVYEGDGFTSVCTTMTAADLSFVHAHESDYNYSSTYFELMYLDDYGVLYPILNVCYCADDPQHIRAVSFDVEGTRYTFEVDPVEPEQLEHGISEDLLIYFGPENADFLVALENIVDECSSADEMMTHRIPAILHGDEDLTVTLSDAFLLDFAIIMKDAYQRLDGNKTFDQLSEVASALTTEAIAPEETPAKVENDMDDITEKLRNMFNK